MNTFLPRILQETHFEQESYARFQGIQGKCIIVTAPCKVGIFLNQFILG